MHAGDVIENCHTLQDWVQFSSFLSSKLQPEMIANCVGGGISRDRRLIKHYAAKICIQVAAALYLEISKIHSCTVSGNFQDSHLCTMHHAFFQIGLEILTTAQIFLAFRRKI